MRLNQKRSPDADCCLRKRVSAMSCYSLALLLRGHVNLIISPCASVIVLTCSRSCFSPYLKAYFTTTKKASFTRPHVVHIMNMNK